MQFVIISYPELVQNVEHIHQQLFQSKKGSNDEKKRKWEEVESQAAGALGVESNIQEENLHQKKKVKISQMEVQPLTRQH